MRRWCTHTKALAASYIIVRAFSTRTRHLHALERVEGAYSYSQWCNTSASRATSASSSSSSSLSPFSSTAPTRRLRTPTRTTRSSLSSSSIVGTNDVTQLVPDDLAGPAETRFTQRRLLRCPLPRDSPFNFFFRHTGDVESAAHDGDDGIDRDSAVGPKRGDSSKSRGFTDDDVDYYCRLCQIDVEPDLGVRGHFLLNNRSIAASHMSHEVCLDTLALLAMRGFSVEHALYAWAHALYSSPLLARVHGLVSPLWSLHERATHLRELLSLLVELGVLDLCFALEAESKPGGNHINILRAHRRRIAFESQEYFGDCAWGTHISSRIMILFPDRQWQYSDSPVEFNSFRDSCEMNNTLENLFDLLQLETFFSPAVVQSGRFEMGKIKADVLESLMGELFANISGMAPAIHDDVPFVEVNSLSEDRICSIVQHCATEVLDLVVLSLIEVLCAGAIPLAKEIAAKFLWLTEKPALLPMKYTRRQRFTVLPRLQSDASQALSAQQPLQGSTTVCSFPHTSGTPSLLSASVSVASRGSVFVLPAQPLVSQQRTPRPAIQTPSFSSPSPVLNCSLSEMPEGTVSAYTGLDVFESLGRSFEEVRSAMALKESMKDRKVVPRFHEFVSQVEPLLAHLLPIAEIAAIETEARDEEGRGCAEAPLLLDPEQQLYWRDRVLDVQLVPKPPADTMLASVAATSGVNFSLRLAYPCITLEPTEQLVSTGAENNEYWCVFAPSQYVPQNVKTPAGGVVTDKNLHWGRFAFLAAGCNDPIEVAMQASESADAEKEGKKDDNDISLEERAVLYWRKVSREMRDNTSAYFTFGHAFPMRTYASVE